MVAGAAPLFFNQRAMDKLKNRKTKVASYYLDMNLVGAYCELPLLSSGRREHLDRGVVTQYTLQFVIFKLYAAYLYLYLHLWSGCERHSAA